MRRLKWLDDVNVSPFLLTVEELNAAEVYLLTVTQQEHFADDTQSDAKL